VSRVRRSRRASSRVAKRWSASVILAAIAAAALISGVAGAAGASRVVSASRNTALNETLVVDSHGRTLYSLHPETTHHLLCRNRACFELWPPLTVRSASTKLVAGHGVEGHLGLLHRSDGKLQVTLRGLPLYRFSGDGAKGQAHGEGIKSFGGTWHAVTAATHASGAPSGMTTPTTSTPSTPTTSTPSMTPPYGY
jgi:predicted lipoprotein with Yx(FWY)xxD motif